MREVDAESSCVLHLAQCKRVIEWWCSGEWSGEDRLPYWVQQLPSLSAEEKIEVRALVNSMKVHKAKYDPNYDNYQQSQVSVEIRGYVLHCEYMYSFHKEADDVTLSDESPLCRVTTPHKISGEIQISLSDHMLGQFLHVVLFDLIHDGQRPWRMMF